jgi:peptide chain release factor subunit 1
LCLFKKKLDQLSHITVPHSTLISVYVPPGKQIDQVREYLRDLHGKIHSEASDQISNSIKQAISSAISFMDTSNPVVKNNGFVLFFGEVNAKLHRQILEPPHPIKGFIYKCEREFFLDPLYEIVADEEKYGIVVMDLADTTIGYLNGSNTSVFARVHSRVSNKHHHGGMSSLRFERLRDDSINEYFKKVSEKCIDAFIDHRLKGIIIGGPAKTKNDFMAGDYLHHELRKIVLDVVDVNRTDKDGLLEAVNAAQSMMTTCRYFQEKRILDHYWAEAGTDGLVVSGMVDTRERLRSGQVQTLILSESLDLYVIEGLKQIADRYDTEVLIIGEEEEFGKTFTSDIKIGGILRYKG